MFSGAWLELLYSGPFAFFGPVPDSSKLLPALEAAGDWKGFAAACERYARISATREEAARWLIRAAHAAKPHLADEALAESFLIRATRMGSFDALQELASIYRSRNADRALAELLETAGDSGEASRGVEEALRECLKLYSNGLRAPHKALKVARAAWRKFPARADFAALLLEQLIRCRRFDEAFDFINNDWPADSPEQRANRLLDAGLSLQNQPLNLKVARRFLARALELKPNASVAARAIENIDRHLADPARQFDVETGNAGDQASPADLSQAYCRAGEWRLLADPNDASAPAMFTRALLLEPGNERAIELLGRTGARDPQPASVLDALAGAAARQPDSSHAAETLVRAGAFAIISLQRKEDAEKWFNQALQRDPSHPVANEVLLELHREFQRIPAAIDIGRGQLERTSSLLERRHLLIRLAALYEDELNERRQARAARMEAELLSPGDEPSFQRLKSLAEDSGDLDAALLAASLAVLNATDQDRAPRLRELAAIKEKRGDHRGAFADFLWAVQIHMESPGEDARRLQLLAANLPREDILDALAAGGPASRPLACSIALAYILEENGDHARALDEYRHLFKAFRENRDFAAGFLRNLERAGGTPGDRQLALHHRMVTADVESRPALAAELILLLLNEDDHAGLNRASEVLEEVREHLPSSAVLRDAAIPVFEGRREWQKLADLLEHDARGENPERSRPARLKLADLLAHRLVRLSEAVEIYRSLLEEDAASPDLGEALARLREHFSGSREIANLLAAHYEAAGRDREWVELVDARVQGMAMGPAVENILKKGAEIAIHRLNDQEAAWRFLVPLFEAHPSDPVLREQLNVAAAAAMRVSDWKRRLREAADKAATGPEKLPFLIDLARLCKSQGGGEEEAARIYGEILHVDSAHPEALNALEAWHRERGHQTPLAELLLNRASRADQAARLVLLREAAGLLEQDSSRQEQTEAAWREILLAVPNDDQAIHGLRKILARTDRWEEWVMLGDRLLGGQPGDAGDPNRLEIAAVLLRRLNNPEEAFRHVRDVIDRQPAHPEALLLLRELAANPATAPDASKLLTIALEQLGEVGPLLELLEARLATESNPVDREALYQRIINTLARRAGQPVVALQWAGQALVEFPANDGFFDVAVFLGEDTGRIEQLVDILESAAHISPGAARKFNFKAAELCEKNLNHPVRAYGLLSPYVQEDPADEGLRDRIQRLAEAANHVSEWSMACLIIAARDNLDASVRLPLRLRAARNYNFLLGEMDNARDAYQSVLALEAGHVEARRELEQVLRKLGGAGELVLFLESEAELSSTPEEKLPRLLEIAELSRAVLNDVSGARSAYSRILELEPNHAVALAALRELAEQAEDWAAALDLRERELGLDGHDSVFARLAAAKLAWERLGDGARALPHLRRVLELHADHDIAIGLAGAISENDAYLADALELLDPCLRNSGDFTHLAALMKRRLDQLEDKAARREVIGRILALGESSVTVRVTLFPIAAGALEEFPDDDGLLAAVEQLAGELDLMKEFAPLLERAAARTSDNARAARYKKKAGLILSKISGAQEAIIRLREALELDPGDESARAEIGRLLRESGDWSGYAAHLDELIERVEEPSRKAELYQELASVAESHLSGAPRAILALRSAIQSGASASQMLDRIISIARAGERWEDLAGALSDRIATVEDPAAAVPFRFELGKVLQEHLRRDSEAVEQFSIILETEPVHSGVENALGEMADQGRETVRTALLAASIRGAGQDWPEVFRYLETAAGAETGPAAKYSLLLRQAAVASERMEDDAKEYSCLRKAFLLPPADAALRERLEFAAAELEMRDDLAELFAEKLELLEADDEMRVALRLRIAEIAVSDLQDKERAIHQYRQVLAEDDNHRGAILSLARLYRETENFDALIEILERKTGTFEDAPQKASVLREIAEVQSDLMSRHAAAVETMRAAVTLDPASPGNYERLDEYLIRAEMHGQRADNLRAWLEAAPPEDRTEIQLRLAETLLSGEETWMEAVEIFSQALRSGDENALATVESWMGESAGAVKVRLALILADHHTSQKNWDAALSALEVAVQDETEGKTALLRTAAIQEKYKDSPDMAFLSVCRAMNRFAADTNLIEEALRLARLADSVEELAHIFDAAAEKLAFEGNELGAVYACRAAHLFEEELDDLDSAVDSYRRALEIDPASTDAMHALDRLFRLNERWTELAEILQLEISAARDAKEKVTLLQRLAKLQEEHLEDREAARATLEKAVELEPESFTVIKRLASFYQDQRDWEAMRDSCQRLIALAQDPEDKVRWLIDLAELEQHRLGNPEKAIEHWEEVLALGQRAEEAFSALDQLLEESGRHERRAELLRQQLEQEQSPFKRAELFVRLGNVLATQLGDPDQAIAAYEEALSDNPDHLAALLELRNLYLDSDRWDDARRILRRLLEESSPDVPEKEVRIALAEGLINREADIEGGLDVLLPAMELEPHDVEELDRMAALFEVTESWIELAQVLAMRAELAGEDDEKLAFLLRAAELQENSLKNREAAIPLYEQVLEIEIDNARAQDALERLYPAAEEWKKLSELLEGRLPLTPDSEGKSAIHEHIADILEHQLGQPELAFLSVNKALRESPRRADLVDRLESLAGASESWEEFVLMLGEVNSRLDEPDISYLLKLARVNLERLDDPGAARENFEAVLERDNGNWQAVRGLVDIHKREDESLSVVTLLKQAIPSLDKQHQVEALIEMAAVYEGPLADINNAIDCYPRILDIAESHRPALEALARIYEREERWLPLINILDRTLQVESDASARVALSARIAGLWRVELKDAREASEWYESALEEDPFHGESFEALDEIYQQRGQHRERANLYNRKAGHEEDPVRKSGLLLKLGAIFLRDIRDAEAARETYRAVLEIEPANLEALRELTTLHQQLGQHDDLIRIIQRRAELAETDSERIEMYMMAGEVFSTALNAPDRAEASFKKVLKIRDGHAGALAALGKLYEGQGNAAAAVDKYEAALRELRQGDPETASLLLAVARLQEESLKNDKAARDAYERALRADETSLPALSALRRLCFAAEDWNAYLKYTGEEARHTDDVEHSARLFVEAATFCEEQLRDSSRAAVFYEEALNLQPENMDAARPLADHYFDEGRWEEAERVLGKIANHALTSGEAGDAAREFHRLAYAQEKLGRAGEALTSYRFAVEQDEHYFPALDGLAHALVRAGRLDEAIPVYQNILKRHGDSLDELEIVDIRYQLGNIHFKRGEATQAMEEISAALAINGNHTACLALAGEIHSSRGEWEEAYDDLNRLAGLSEPRDQAALYMRVGGICEERLSDPYRAIDAYLLARKADPKSADVLQRLFNLYKQTRQGARAVETGEDLVQTVSDPGEKVRLLTELADVHADILNNVDAAVRVYNEALDIHYAAARAFARIEQLLSKNKRWKELEENYIRMIKRLPKEAVQPRLVLWQTLAEFYRQVMKSPVAAIKAYEVLRGYDKTNLKYLEALGELYTESPDHVEKAIEIQHDLLERTTTPVKHYRELLALYRKKRKHDPYYMLLTVMHFLQQAEERQLQEMRALARGLKQGPTRSLSDQIWEDHLFHPHVRNHISGVFSLLYRRLPTVFATGAMLDVKRKDLVDPNSPEEAVRVYLEVQRALNIGAPELFAPHTLDKGLSVINTSPPSIAAGQDIFRGRSREELMFAFGRAMTFTRTEFVMPRVLPLDVLRAVFDAAVSAFDAGFSSGADPRETDNWRKKITKGLSPEASMELKRRVLAWLADPQRVTLEQWVEGVELTSHRTGMLLAGDIGLVLRMLKNDVSGVTVMPYRAVMREMLVFVASRDHFLLREKTGLAIGS
ncbi:MAG: Photosystem I assembly protein Ycf3 [Myxococcota bacterium]|nr:Photosystem I assembly protein Ycf3 [Myxococcota bacterium]